MKRFLSLVILSGCGLGAPSEAAEGPLTLPAAIVEQCKPPNSALVCEDLQSFLDAMNAETRKDAWAREMEARIRKAIRMDGKPVPEIRVLQCRRARCALVYSIAEKDAAREVDGDDALDQLMDVRTGTEAPEASGDGAPKIVRMLVYQRRVHIEDTAKPEEAVEVGG
jgi:hypothetical protein